MKTVHLPRLASKTTALILALGYLAEQGLSVEWATTKPHAIAHLDCRAILLFSVYQLVARDMMIVQTMRSVSSALGNVDLCVCRAMCAPLVLGVRLRTIESIAPASVPCKAMDTRTVLDVSLTSKTDSFEIEKNQFISYSSRRTCWIRVPSGPRLCPRTGLHWQKVSRSMPSSKPLSRRSSLSGWEHSSHQNCCLLMPTWLCHRRQRPLRVKYGRIESKLARLMTKSCCFLSFQSPAAHSVTEMRTVEIQSNVTWATVSMHVCWRNAARMPFALHVCMKLNVNALLVMLAIQTEHATLVSTPNLVEVTTKPVHSASGGCCWPQTPWVWLERKLSFVIAVPETEPPYDPGCDSNSDCPVHKACRNRLCIDPCIEDDPCAKLAFCRVDIHQPVCKCPKGFFGDPRVECKKRKLFSPLLSVAVASFKCSC